jgi:transposase
VAEIGGIDGNSRETIQSFCSSVLGFKISLGAIQKVIDRASKAILPHYEAIKDKARSVKVNHVDETT